MGDIKLGKLYELLRGDLHKNNDTFWRIRTWAVLLSGAGAGFCIEALNTTPVDKALISDALVYCAIVISACSFLNLIFWLLISFKTLGYFRIAAYLYFLEIKDGIVDGWESWVAFIRKEKMDSGFDVIKTDIIFWESVRFFV